MATEALSELESAASRSGRRRGVGGGVGGGVSGGADDVGGDGWGDGRGDGGGGVGGTRVTGGAESVIVDSHFLPAQKHSSTGQGREPQER